MKDWNVAILRHGKGGRLVSTYFGVWQAESASDAIMAVLKDAFGERTYFRLKFVEGGLATVYARCARIHAILDGAMFDAQEVL